MSIPGMSLDEGGSAPRVHPHKAMSEFSFRKALVGIELGCFSPLIHDWA